MANSPLGEPLEYSKSPVPSLTLKLIIDGCDTTPSRASSRSKRGIVAVVEDDEAGVDVQRLVGGVDADRVGVPAGVVAGLEHGDLVVAVQQMRHHQARHAGADDRDPHRSRLDLPLPNTSSDSHATPRMDHFLCVATSLR